MRIGTTELIVILIVVVIIFGPTQIPKLMKMLGEGIRAFRDGIESVDNKNETTLAGTLDKKDATERKEDTNKESTV